MIYTSKKNKLSKTLLLTLVFIIFLVITTISYFFWSAVPQMSGQLKLKGLENTVVVQRDINGIPHIEAKNNHDAYMALGYIVASERLFQMDMARRLAKGELSEVIGKSALKSDLLYRNLGLRRQAEKIIEEKKANGSFNDEMLRDAEAFFKGVNLFIEIGDLPVEYHLLRTTPQTFDLVDSYSFVGMMGFSFGIAIMTEPLLTKLKNQIGPELVDDLRIEKLENEAALMTSVENIELQEAVAKKVLGVISWLEKGFTLFEGSNGWVLAGSRTASGKPMLANDPHISFSHPGIWFEAHIKTPTYENYGHFLPTIPFAVLSHNSKRAWGLTMSLTDDMDLFKENIDKETMTYFFKDQTLNLETYKEIIKVKNQKDETLNVFRTHHGPIIESLSGEKGTEAISLQWAFYSEGNDPLSALYGMDHAKNMQEFKASVAQGISPGLNILYADEANIGWWMFGEVWKKKAGLKRDFILDGQSGEDEILGIMPFSEKPSLENPKNGIIVSANSRPAAFPANIRGDWQPSDRFETIEATLMQKREWTVQESMELQTLNMNFENKKILSALIKNLTIDENDKDYKVILDILKNWNFESSLDSVGASLFYTWTRELQIALLNDLSLEEKEIFAKVPNGHIFFKRVLYDDTSVWWSRFDKKQIITESLNHALSSLSKKFGPSPKDWQWGRIHKITFRHPFSQIKPLGYIFNLGSYGAPGATQEVNNFKSTSFKGETFEVTAGPSTRRIIDFKTPETSYGILPTGISGHVLSPFYRNQVRSFLEGKYRKQWLNPGEEDIYSTLELIP